MTYGPTVKWRLPFIEKIDLHIQRKNYKTAFVALSVAACLLVLVLFSYFNGNYVSNAASRFNVKHDEVESKVFHETDPLIWKGGSIAVNSKQVGNDNEESLQNKEPIQHVETPKQIDQTNAVPKLAELKYSETDVDSTEFDDFGDDLKSSGDDADVGNETTTEEIDWNDPRLNILAMVSCMLTSYTHMY